MALKRSRFDDHRGQGTQVNRKALAWWREARFGMFIHWGVYAVPAGRWKGQKIPGLGEWIMFNRKIPVAEYEKLATKFSPARFDADSWVRLAKKAGMKYLVITSKHHDGFVMFRSAASRFNIADATPWGRDPMKALAAACRRHGLRFCFYYSQYQDWHDPDGAGNDWDYDERKKVFRRYLDRTVKPHLRELLTQYGPIDLIWFDTPMTMSRRHSLELRRFVRGLQPDCLVSGRIGNDLGDYGSLGDNMIPVGRVQGDYETPVTINETWGYKSYDRNWKSARTLLCLIVDLASKGVNCLLNVGPTAKGVIPIPSVTRLKEIGRWMRVHGEAIYGASASPFPYEPEWGRMTQKPGRLYLIFFNWPKGAFVLRGLKNRVTEARVLGPKGARLQVEHGRDPGTGVDVLTLRGLPPKPESQLGVVRLKIRGRAAVADQSCLQQPDGVIQLPAILAQILNSPSARSMGVSRHGVTTGWTNKANRMSWRFKLLSVGTYDVFVQWSKRKGATRPPRHRVAVEIAGRRLACDLCEDAVVATPRTGHLPESLARAGTVTFDSPGTYTTKLRAIRLDRADKAGLVLVGLRLEPAG